MAKIGFTRKDFEVFDIPTFPERMQGIKERVRPKLTALGKDLQPALTKIADSDVFPHVAHAYTADCQSPSGNLGCIWSLGSRL